MKKCELGWYEQNVFHYRRALDELLAANPDCPITSDELIAYDLNIVSHWKSITRQRNLRENREIYPLPFQYLILLFTCIISITGPGHNATKAASCSID